MAKWVHRVGGNNLKGDTGLFAAWDRPGGEGWVTGEGGGIIDVGGRGDRVKVEG